MAEKLTQEQVSQLEKYAQSIRYSIVQMVTEAQSGHPGGSLSAADILTTLYFAEMNVNLNDPQAASRDRFVLSKGHAAPVLYATLAEKGFFPKEELLTLRRIDSRLQGHPSMKNLPGIDMSTGSLGQGLSAAAGLALAARLDNSASRVYTVLGDGELEEGMVWEAAMFAAHYKLDNLTAFVDFNGLQIDGPISEVLSPLPIPEKWAAFNWHVIQIDGHDIQAIYDAIQTAKTIKGKPTMIVAQTIKGKGVCEMENIADWHGKAPTRQQCDLFLSQLNELEAQ
ncbi:MULTISPECIES: transketolase [Pelosinus]|uniref:Transketolase domain-containing protein n=1 Tax=Pelosinus fermentans B4 TaxID=1149862 RepID=I8RP75_9FIRM|nr:MULTISPECIES: transketolase [Pelosinus]EIW20955.1 Transketolase domain-containing protein [Pelosinus fermentans B4]EIW27177.1 Transketolase domain-containing protein [Pelosinus fermentans A11]